MNKIITGDVYCVKKGHLAGYLMMQGFKLKRMPVDEKNPNYNVYIFNNSEALQQAVTDYFKMYN